MAYFPITGPGPFTDNGSNNVYKLPKGETITSAANENGIFLNGSDNLIKIAGRVKADGLALFAGGYNTVSITATGKVRSETDVHAIMLGSGHLVNDGTIQADKGLTAILSGSGAFSLLNTGSIFGRVLLRGKAQEVVNHGEIKTRSSEAAVYMRESDSHLENSGRIVGGVGVEMRLRDDLVNSGLIEGRDGIAILADGTVENSGKIIGDVVFDPSFRSRPLGGDSRDGVFTALPGGWVKGAVIGADWDDTFTGNARADRFRGGDGEDDLVGRGGNDRLSGGAGDDLIRAGDQDTFIYGDAGRDRIFDGDGNSFLYGGSEADLIKGAGGRDALSGNDGDDRLFGGDGDDTLSGNAGNDVLNGGAGADTFSYFDTANGRDRIVDFEDGSDRIDLASYGVLTRGFADAAAFADSAVTNRHGNAIIDLSVLTGITGKIVVIWAAGQIDETDFFLG